MMSPGLSNAIPTQNQNDQRMLSWLAVEPTPLKNESGRMIILNISKNKNVPNHQPVSDIEKIIGQCNHPPENGEAESPNSLFRIDGRDLCKPVRTGLERFQTYFPEGTINHHSVIYIHL